MRDDISNIGTEKKPRRANSPWLFVLGGDNLIFVSSSSTLVAHEYKFCAWNERSKMTKNQ